MLAPGLCFCLLSSQGQLSAGPGDLLLSGFLLGLLWGFGLLGTWLAQNLGLLSQRWPIPGSVPGSFYILICLVLCHISVFFHIVCMSLDLCV